MYGNIPTTRLIAALLAVGIGGFVVYASFHAQYVPDRLPEQKSAVQNEIYRPELLYIEDYHTTDNLLTPQYNTGILGGSSAVPSGADTLTGEVISSIIGPYYERLGESVGKTEAQRKELDKLTDKDVEQEVARVIEEARKKITLDTNIRLVASDDNSAEAKARYLAAIDGIVPVKNEDLAFFANPPRDPSVAQFKIRLQFVIKGYDDAIARVVVLPVPSDWLPPIQEGVEALALQRDAFALFARGDEDALAMAVATELLGKALDQYAQAEKDFRARL